MKYSCGFILVWWFITISAFSETVQVNGITAECIIQPDMTMEQARRLAIEDAKKEAVRKVAGEYIRSVDISHIQDTWQTFASYSVIEVDGGIVDYILKNESYDKDRFGNIKVTVTIDAEVLKYKTKRDPSFFSEIKGIKSIYGKDEILEFDITSHADSYLRIFVFENFGDAMQLFPNSYDKQNLIKKEEKIVFPQKVNFRWTKSLETETEYNHLVFVFTKQFIPFYGEVSFDSVDRWINEIEPSDRFVQYYSIGIR